MQSTYHPAASSSKLHHVFDKHSELCREDIIWVLDYIRQKLASQDPELLNMPQQRLLRNFHSFAEIAMMIIHQRGPFDQETDRIKSWVQEASYGLRPEKK